LRVTVRPASPFLRSLLPTDSPNTAMAASISPRSVRSRANVRSLLTDFTSSGSSMRATALLSRPCARRFISSALTPKMGRRIEGAAEASWPSVWMPAFDSSCSARLPIPLIARTGRGDRNPCSVPGRTTVSPRGLSRSLAILATVLLQPKPIEHVTPKLDTRFDILRAMSIGLSEQ